MIEVLKFEDVKYKNDIFLVKIILDIYLDYYKNFDTPINNVKVLITYLYIYL